MPKKQSSTPLLPIIIIFAVIAGGLFYLFRTQRETAVIPSPARQENISRSSAESRGDLLANSVTENLIPNPDQNKQETHLRLAPMDAVSINPCLEATQKLDLFFTYLDEQEYIQKYQFSHGSKEIISSLLKTLLESPPDINDKILNRTNIIHNSAHIYRTLGAQNLTLLLKIIKNEADLMEETCGYFHEWANISTKCLNHPYPLHPTLKNLYEYAAFFQQTTGGKAYLARREGNIRLLAQYYSVLIIHQAEQQGLNKYNIKLTSHLPHLIVEMEASEELAGKNNYLALLYDIREQLSNFAIRK